MVLMVEMKVGVAEGESRSRGKAVVDVVVVIIEADDKLDGDSEDDVGDM